MKNPISVKPKRHSIFGKIIKGQFVANLWNILSEGHTKDEALENLKSKITLRENEAFFHIYRMTKHGVLFHLFYCGCYAYHIVRFKDNGEVLNSSTCMMGNDKQDAIVKFNRHFEQFSFDEQCIKC